MPDSDEDYVPHGTDMFTIDQLPAEKPKQPSALLASFARAARKADVPINISADGTSKLYPLMFASNHACAAEIKKKPGRKPKVPGAAPVPRALSQLKLHANDFEEATGVVEDTVRCSQGEKGASPHRFPTPLICLPCCRSIRGRGSSSVVS